MQEKLSNALDLIVITKNEEINIKSCLESVGWAGEIVIVDTGSMDRTIEIAKRYTNKIYSYPFNGSFADVRNFALSKAKGGWVLFIDADETLEEKAKDKILELITSAEYDGFWFPRRNYINEKTYLKHGYFYPDFQLRLFRNSGRYQYSGRIHEHLNIPKNKTSEVKDVELLHNWSHTKYDSFFHFNRFYPYIKIEGLEIAKSDASFLYLVKESLVLPVRHMYQSFIRYKGYKDRYAGFRAGALWGIYESSRYMYALYIRLLKII